MSVTHPNGVTCSASNLHWWLRQLIKGNQISERGMPLKLLNLSSDGVSELVSIDPVIIHLPFYPSNQPLLQRMQTASDSIKLAAQDCHLTDVNL